MKRILLITIILSFINAQYNLETCTTNIAVDVPEFFHKYFHCVTAKMSTSGDYVNLYFNGKPPYETWYYDGGANDINYNPIGSPVCPPGPPSGDCYFQVPNNIAEVDYVISIPVNPVPIDGNPKGQNSVDGIYNSTDANEYPLGTIGVALNGVNVYNPVAAGDDLIEDEMYGFDLYSGHPDFEGAYHYHSTSQGPLEVLKHKMPNHVTQTTPGSTEIELYGITCDGIVIMGCTELDKSSPDFSSLDAQHGHVHDLVDENGTTLLENRYHTHLCYSSFTENDNIGNGFEDHEFNPESAYYVSMNTNPSKNACEASTTPYEADAALNAKNTKIAPTTFSFQNAYPNPFNPTTTISFQLSHNTNMNISIYDIKGNKITTLLNEFKHAGKHSINWDATNHASGIYIAKMITQEYMHVQKLMLIK